MTTTMAWLLLSATVGFHGDVSTAISPPLPSYKACAALSQKLRKLEDKAGKGYAYFNEPKYLCYQTRVVTGK